MYHFSVSARCANFTNTVGKFFSSSFANHLLDFRMHTTHKRSLSRSLWLCDGNFNTNSFVFSVLYSNSLSFTIIISQSMPLVTFVSLLIFICVYVRTRREWEWNIVMIVTRNRNYTRKFSFFTDFTRLSLYRLPYFVILFFRSGINFDSIRIYGSFDFNQYDFIEFDGLIDWLADHLS